MRRKRAFKGSRAVPILLAGLLGYGLGGWNTSALRNTGLSAAQTVALRFPQDWGNAADMTATAAAPSAGAMDDPQLALLSPQPMVGRTSVPQASAPQAAVSQAAVPQAPVSQPAMQMAAADPAVPARASDDRAVSQPAPAATRTTDIKPVPAPVHRPSDRPGFILNDAQIASIKARLHLTSDQEQMWPAVEAALRNIAYLRARETRGHGAPANAAQLAAADPNSVEVQGLKSAAIPLLMSFDAEQKDEVRSLAHVMGLDQLASQF
jgi:hypothetical protein